MQIDLSGKVALVTGAAGELGRVMARTLAHCGADVVVHYFRSEQKAQSLAQEIRGMGRRVATVSADVGNEDQVKAMHAQVVSQLGAPDIVVTNAVVQYQWTNILKQGVADFESQFRSCVLQNLFMAQAFAPAMIEKGWGRIVAINTECAMQCAPTQGAYVSGKRGMDGLLRVLAREIGQHNVTVNQVAPGWMISEKYREGGERQPQYEANIPLRHRGEDQDVANLVAFLASDLAKYITGAYISVSGGNVMPTI